MAILFRGDAASAKSKSIYTCTARTGTPARAAIATQTPSAYPHAPRRFASNHDSRKSGSAPSLPRSATSSARGIFPDNSCTATDTLPPDPKRNPRSNVGVNASRLSAYRWGKSLGSRAASLTRVRIGYCARPRQAPTHFLVSHATIEFTLTIERTRNAELH